MMKLYNAARSSASYRVRIALNLKGLPYEYLAANPQRPEGEFLAASPQRLIPVMVEEERSFIQSLAIIEYLEETHPAPPLLPANPIERARVRALALIVACEMHPLNNLRSLQYLRAQFKCDEETVRRWYHHWLAAGFEPLERLLASSPQTGAFCHGDAPTLADVFLVPQIANANRYGFDMSPYPTLSRINETCLKLAAFQRAAPQNQPDM